MSLDPPTYLNSLQHNIRARPIPWEGAVRAGTLAEKELKQIKAIDKVRKEQRKKTVEDNVEAYCTLLLGGNNGTRSVLEAAAKRPDVLQYILVLTGDLLNDIPNFTRALLQKPDPYRPFLPLLSYASNPEEPIPLLTSSVLSTLLGEAQAQISNLPDNAEAALVKLFQYLASLTRSQDSGLQDIAIQEYATVLRSAKSRLLFWKHRKDTFGPLMDILRAAAGASKDSDSSLWSGGASIRAGETGLSGGVGLQLLYHVLLVNWLLSFEAADIGQEFEEEEEVIPLYVQLLRLSPKEKTTRLLLATLDNLLSQNRESLIPVAVAAKLPALLENLKGRHLSDPDLLEDMNNLIEMLDDYTSSQTTFDEYAAEVQTGHLRWSPPHRSATFWTENANRILTENKGELPRKLASILAKSWDSDKQVLAIGCNDVGWLVKQCPEKRNVLEKLGIKTRVMELMADSDESVKWESLKAVGDWLKYSFDQT